MPDEGYFVRLGINFDPSGIEAAQAAIAQVSTDIAAVGEAGKYVSSVGEYFTNLGAAASQFGGVVKDKVSGALEGVADAAKATATGVKEMMDQVGDSFGPIGSQITDALTNPLAMAATAITALAAASLEAWASMDSGLDAITIKTGKMGDEMEAMEKTMTSILPNVAQSAEEVGNAMGTLAAKTGLQGEELEKLSVQYLHLAELTGGSVTPLIQEASRVFAKWKVDTSQQAEALDKLMAVSQRTGTEFKKLTDDAQKFAGAFQMVGYNFDSAVQIIGKLEKSGANTELVLRSMQQAMTKLAEAGKDPVQSFQDLIVTLQNVDEATGATLLKQVGITKGFAEFSEAVKNGTLDWRQYAGTLADTQGTIDKTREAIADYPEQFKLLKNELTPVLKMLGTEMAKGLGDLATILKPIVSGVAALAKGFQDLSPSWKGFIVDLIPGIQQLRMLSTALATVAKLTGKDPDGFVSNLESMNAAARKNQDMMSGMIGSIQRFNAELPKGNINLDLLGKKSGEAAKELKKLNDAAEKMAETAQKIAIHTGDLMKPLDMGDVLGKDYVEMVKLNTAFEKMDAAVRAAQPSVQKLVQELLKTDQYKLIVAASTAEVTKAAAAVKEWDRVAKEFGITLKTDIQDRFHKLWVDFDQVTEAYRAGAISAEEYARAQLKLAEASLQAAIAGGKTKEEINNIKGAVDRAKAALDSFQPTIKQTDKAFEEFQGTLHQTWYSFQEDITQAIVHMKGFGDAIKAVWNDIKTAFVRLIVKEMFQSFADSLKNGEGLFAGFAKSVKGIFDGLFKAISNGLSALFGGASSAAGGAGGAAGAGASALGLGLTSTVTAISGVVSAITGVLSFLSGRRMEQDIGRVEVTTRGILNQSIAIQQRLDQWLPYLGGIQDAVRALAPAMSEVLTRLQAAIGGLAQGIGAAAAQAGQQGTSAVAQAFGKLTGAVGGLEVSGKQGVQSQLNELNQIAHNTSPANQTVAYDAIWAVLSGGFSDLIAHWDRGVDLMVGELKSIRGILLEIDTAMQFTAMKLGKPEWNVNVVNTAAPQSVPSNTFNLQNSTFSAFTPQQLVQQITRGLSSAMGKR